MSRASRFDKLENERRPATQPKSLASLERFAEPPAPAGREDAPLPAAALERFSSDGADAVRTNDDALVQLPCLLCPACGGQAGKFDVSCFNCGTRLDTREAREHNLARLEALEAERAEERARAAARREAEIAQAAELREAKVAELKKELEGIKRAYDGPHGELVRHVRAWIAILVCAGLALKLAGAPRLLLGIVTLVLILTRLPRGVWRHLGHRGHRL